MENIGDGENVRKTEKSNTAGPSLLSQKNGKQRTKKIKQPTTPEEAAELLTSALAYCLEAGLVVTGYNEEGALRLSIDGLEYADEKIKVALPVAVGVPSVTIGVTV